ncbi:hypothetical protein F4804DRAFT_330582 [Jackrogersella minutella]|nr:hypothetical protein F4804DRAFT_330582 [Jackrogersella minutella]
MVPSLLPLLITFFYLSGFLATVYESLLPVWGYLGWGSIYTLVAPVLAVATYLCVVNPALGIAFFFLFFVALGFVVDFLNDVHVSAWWVLCFLMAQITIGKFTSYGRLGFWVAVGLFRCLSHDLWTIGWTVSDWLFCTFYWDIWECNIRSYPGNYTSFGFGIIVASWIQSQDWKCRAKTKKRAAQLNSLLRRGSALLTGEVRRVANKSKACIVNAVLTAVAAVAARVHYEDEEPQIVVRSPSPRPAPAPRPAQPVQPVQPQPPSPPEISGELQRVDASTRSEDPIHDRFTFGTPRVERRKRFGVDTLGYSPFSPSPCVGRKARCMIAPSPFVRSVREPPPPPPQTTVTEAWEEEPAPAPAAAPELAVEPAVTSQEVIVAQPEPPVEQALVPEVAPALEPEAPPQLQVQQAQQQEVWDVAPQPPVASWEQPLPEPTYAPTIAVPKRKREPEHEPTVASKQVIVVHPELPIEVALFPEYAPVAARRQRLQAPVYQPVAARRQRLQAPVYQPAAAPRQRLQAPEPHPLWSFGYQVPHNLYIPPPLRYRPSTAPAVGPAPMDLDGSGLEYPVMMDFETEEREDEMEVDGVGDVPLNKQVEDQSEQAGQDVQPMEIEFEPAAQPAIPGLGLQPATAVQHVQPKQNASQPKPAAPIRLVIQYHPKPEALAVEDNDKMDEEEDEGNDEDGQPDFRQRRPEIPAPAGHLQAQGLLPAQPSVPEVVMEGVELSSTPKTEPAKPNKAPKVSPCRVVKGSNFVTPPPLGLGLTPPRAASGPDPISVDFAFQQSPAARQAGGKTRPAQAAKARPSAAKAKANAAKKGRWEDRPEKLAQVAKLALAAMPSEPSKPGPSNPPKTVYREGHLTWPAVAENARPSSPPEGAGKGKGKAVAIATTAPAPQPASMVDEEEVYENAVVEFVTFGFNDELSRSMAEKYLLASKDGSMDKATWVAQYMSS